MKKKMKLPKTSKNDGLPPDFFRRAKRARKTLISGLQKHCGGEHAQIRIYAALLETCHTTSVEMASLDSLSRLSRK